MFPYVSTNKLLDSLKKFNYVSLDSGVELMVGDNDD